MVSQGVVKSSKANILKELPVILFAPKMSVCSTKAQNFGPNGNAFVYNDFENVTSS